MKMEIENYFCNFNISGVECNVTFLLLPLLLFYNNSHAHTEKVNQTLSW